MRLNSSPRGDGRGGEGSVLAYEQLTLQILNFLLICDSEDIDGTTDVAGMTHIQFFGNPRAADNGFRSDQPCQSLLASVIMSNHYHLAVETPEGNLIEGMRWLQGTFGIRFNALREEHGHVFQSRYKSLVIEEGRPLLGLVNYIHLNPVRVGLVTVAKLRAYEWSSYPKFFKNRLPHPLRRERFLYALEFPTLPPG